MHRWLAGLVLGVLAVAAAARDGYWAERERGWYWYASPPPPPPPPPASVTVTLATPPPVEFSPPVASLSVPAPPVDDLAGAPELAAHQALQRRLDNSRIIAIMSPTPANLSRYMLAQQEVMDRAATFATVWERVLWTRPDLDETVGGRPTNAAALRTWDTLTATGRATSVAHAAADHGLFFLFGDDCPHCAQMAALLDRFSRRHGMAVQAVAVAGAHHPSFPDAWPDNGFAAASGARRLPAVLLARTGAGPAGLVPVAYGPLADAELAERVAALAAPGP